MALVQFLFHFNLAYYRIVDESVYSVSVLNLIEGSCFDYECIVYRCFIVLYLSFLVRRRMWQQHSVTYTFHFACLCECVCVCMWRMSMIVPALPNRPCKLSFPIRFPTS